MRRAAGHDAVGDRGQAIDVGPGALAAGCAVEFRRGVARRGIGRGAGAAASRIAGIAEVDDDRLPFAVDDHVFGLEVAVQDVLAVQVGHGVGQAGEKLAQLSFGHRRVARLQDFLQRPPGDVRQHQDILVVDLAQAQQAGDTGVIEAAQDRRFALQPVAADPSCLWSLRSALRRHLQHDALAARRVACFEDLASRACGDLAKTVEGAAGHAALRGFPPGLERPFVRNGGRPCVSHGTRHDEPPSGKVVRVGS